MFLLLVHTLHLHLDWAVHIYMYVFSSGQDHHHRLSLFG